MLGASILDMPKVPPGVGEVLVGLVGIGWREEKRREKERTPRFESFFIEVQPEEGEGISEHTVLCRSWT